MDAEAPGLSLLAVVWRDVDKWWNQELHFNSYITSSSFPGKYVCIIISALCFAFNVNVLYSVFICTWIHVVFLMNIVDPSGEVTHLNVDSRGGTLYSIKSVQRKSSPNGF